MLNNKTVRNFAFEGVDMNILKVYAKNVADNILNGLRGKTDSITSLFDFAHMKDEKGQSINQLFGM